VLLFVSINSWSAKLIAILDSSVRPFLGVSNIARIVRCGRLLNCRRVAAALIVFLLLNTIL
jgi:hypothetical protein